MRTKLTPGFCSKASVQPGRERSIYWDASLPGFGLQVTKSGHRSFVIQYRAAGRSRRMAIDGVLGLVNARKRAKALLGAAANDKDPLEERRQTAAASANTLRAIAEDYLRLECGVRRDAEGRPVFPETGGKLRSARQRLQMLERLVYPKLGKHPIANLKRSDLVRRLDAISDENGPVMADRVLATMRRIMNWHASRSDDFRSPIVRGMARTSGKERKRARILTDDELRAVWKAAGAAAGPFGQFVKFLLLTGARRNEAAGLLLKEIETRTEDTTDWILPAARNKVKIDLVRPLSSAARAIVDQLPRIGKPGYVFTTSGRAPIGGFSKFKAGFDQAADVADWTLHDLRRTARSLMSRAGVPSDHAEICLGHVLTGVRGTYDRYEYYAEKKRAFEMLAAQIDRILKPQPNVIPLHGDHEGLAVADLKENESAKVLSVGDNPVAAHN
jgi:integrase